MIRFKSVQLVIGIARVTLAAAILGLGLHGCSSNEVNYTPPAGSSDTAITHFSFAKMVVDGKEFRDVDVAIGPDGNARPWRMLLGHIVDAGDVESLLTGAPHTLIIGIGVSSQASVTPALSKAMRDRGIAVQILDTMDAVNLFNRLPKQGLVAVFHTGC